MLVALLAVVLATVLALSMIEISQRGQARTQALIEGERSLQLARGMELLAFDWLQNEDLPAQLTGEWSAPFSVPGGAIQGRLIDQNARFNLNALAHPDPQQALDAQRQFERLLRLLELDPVLAVELADWLNPAGGPRPGAPGEAWYAGQQPPYRQAGQLLVHVSELRWLRSVDGQVLQRLSPHVTALPEPVRLLNVQTADEWVLASLFVDIALADARRLASDRPFRDVADFLAHPLVGGRLTPAEAEMLIVHSRWFVAQARVSMNDRERDYFRLMQRGASGYDFRLFSQGVF